MRSGCYSQPHAAHRLLRLACRCAWHGTATAVISSVRDAWLSTHSATHGDVLHLQFAYLTPAVPSADASTACSSDAAASGLVGFSSWASSSSSAVRLKGNSRLCSATQCRRRASRKLPTYTHTQMQHVRTRCGMRGAMVAGLNKSVAGRASLHTMVRQCATTQTPSAAFCGTCQSTASCAAGLYDEKILTAAH